MLINGFNHQVSWKEFREVDSSPNHAHAETVAEFNLSYGFQGSGRNCKINKVEISIAMNRSKSWVVKGKQNATLLKHEQGHYDVTAIGARDLHRKLNNFSGNCKNIQSQVKDIAKKIQQKIDSYNKRYDQQTDHGQIASEQQTWDGRIRSIKNNPKGTIDGLP